ncbi:MAG: ABC transporter substrate-binding protein [Xanthobacteraceae bacterium]
MRRTIALITTMIAASVPACLACSATAETLKVAVAQRGFWNSSFIEFALQQGFFKQEGLDIEILYTEGGASTLTPVVAGGIELVSGAPPTACSRTNSTPSLIGST